MCSTEVSIRVGRQAVFEAFVLVLVLGWQVEHEHGRAASCERMAISAEHI